MTDASMIELRGVDKWYGDFHVLRNINLDVGKGERVVVCGPCLVAAKLIVAG